VLYSSIDIYTSRLAEHLAFVLNRSALLDTTPARHIKHLLIDLWYDRVTETALSDISTVLIDARQLQSLKVDYECVQIAMIIGPRTFAASLTKLDLSILYAHVPTVLIYLGLFSRLHSLKLFISPVHPRDSPDSRRLSSIDTNLKWDLPLLQSLRLLLSGEAGAFIPFLCRCKFPILNIIELHTEFRSLAEARLVSRFFADLRIQPLHSVSMELPIEEYQHIIFPCIRTVSFRAWSPTRLKEEFITTLAPSVTILRIQHVGDHAELCSFFDRLLQAQDVGIKEICLEGWYPEVGSEGAVDWIVRCREDDPWHERALDAMDFIRYALLLCRKHINLRDASGRTVMDHFQSA
jgi:hypothetical protein